LDYQANWYLSRRIPITHLVVEGVESCPKGLISMNSQSLRELTCIEIPLDKEDVSALSQCLNLTKVQISDCGFPSNFEIGSIFQNLTSLDELHLRHDSVSRTTIDILSRCCRSVRFLSLLFMTGVGDGELRCLLGGCHSLCSLKMYYLDITDESVPVLIKHQPQILSIGLSVCERLSWDSVITLLTEITIPTILNNKDYMMRRSALEHFIYTIPDPYFDISGVPHVISFFAHNPFLNRLVELVSLNDRLRDAIISLFKALSERGYKQSVVDSGVIPVIIRLFNSFTTLEQKEVLSILNFVTSHGHLLLSSGVLSIIRPSPLHVSFYRITVHYLLYFSSYLV
jgi:hypothetical protein